MSDVRRKITFDFARWAALSSLRSGAPLKSRSDIYPLLDAVSFGQVLDSPKGVTGAEFDAWHEKETITLCRRDPRLPIGWGVKLINVFLKTACYIGELGDPQLRGVLHPPIDAGLWQGLAARFPERQDILADACCVARIKGITDYQTYRRY